MSISGLYPNLRPSLLLDFAQVGRLDPRVSFSRASSATVYDGVTTAKAEENLLLQSQDFLTNWNITRLVRTADADTAPDGTVTADSIVQAAGQTSAGVITASPSISAQAGAITVSIFAKPDGKDFIVFRDLHSDGTVNLTWFDVQNGTVGTTDPGHTAVITASTNGYYRCSITYTANAARNADVSFFIADTDGSLTVVDDGNGLYIWGAQFEQRSAVTAYTPTTTQPITNYIPVLQTAAAGVARFDHNPTTGEALGLLIEEQRANLVTYSDDFADAAWTKSAASITSNTIVAPDGTLTGDALIENTATNEHRINQTASATLNANITASLYVKAQPTGTGRSVRLLVANNGATTNNISCVFTNTGGVFTAGAGVNSGTASGATGTVTSVGNGWYRLIVTGIPDPGVGSGTALSRINLHSGATVNYTGDGYSGIFIWGAQLEAGAFATSYIPTTTASVTRNADAASMTGTNFSSWFNNAEGALYAEGSYIGLQASKPMVSINDSTSSNVIQIQTNPSTASTSRGYIASGGTAQATIGTAGIFALNQYSSLALAYASNDFAMSSNGLAVSTDTSGTVPSVSRLEIGNAYGIQSSIYISRIAYYPQRLTDAQLQALTG